MATILEVDIGNGQVLRASPKTIYKQQGNRTVPSHDEAPIGVLGTPNDAAPHRAIEIDAGLKARPRARGFGGHAEHDPAVKLQQDRARGHGPPYVKIGRAVRYRVAQVEAWLAAHAVTPGVRA